MGRIQLPVALMIICAVKCLAMSYDELEDFADYLQRTSQLSPILKKGVEADDPDDSEEVSDDAWEESGKFEGDLILNERQRRLIIENVAEGLSRNGIRDGTKRWPNNEVIYFIQVEHFRHDQVQAIHSAIEDLQRASCIKFRRYKKGDPDAVVIQGSRRGCFSQVGYQGGYQVLNLSGRHPTGRGCFRHGTIVHELLHTLGFYHMQSSPVRDDYVDIIWDNIVQAARHNFRKYNSFSVSNFGVSYDYDSVLHYSKRAFSVNGQDTIVPKKKGVTIGQRVGLSEKDTQKLNKMYCDADSDEEEEANNNKNKKKVIRKKPKQIQGLGYHQGKAVVFKVPTAIPHKLPQQHSDYPFNYFSKKPQILPSSENEEYGAGKEMIYSYNSKEIDEYEEPIYYMKEDQELYNRDEPEESNQYENPNKVESVITINQAKDIKKPYRADSPEELLHNHDETQEPSLIEAFDRLSKIIKSHVYPSQTPDLSIYKINERLTDRDDRDKIKKDHVDLVIISPNKKPMSQVEKMNAAMHFINKLYDMNQSYKRLEDEYLPKIEYDYYKKHRTKVVPQKEKIIKYVDPSYTSFSDDYEDSPTLSTVRYGGQDEYGKLTSMIIDGERPLGNHDNYHQNKYKGVSLDHAPRTSADGQHRPLRYLYLADKRPLDIGIMT